MTRTPFHQNSRYRTILPRVDTAKAGTECMLRVCTLWCIRSAPRKPIGTSRALWYGLATTPRSGSISRPKIANDRNPHDLLIPVSHLLLAGSPGGRFHNSNRESTRPNVQCLDTRRIAKQSPQVSRGYRNVTTPVASIFPCIELILPISLGRLSLVVAMHSRWTQNTVWSSTIKFRRTSASTGQR
jgi:hypothetical protein